MSHTTKLSLIVKDLTSLAAAAKALGGELVRDAKTFVYFAGNKEACDHAIRFPNTNGYEIGVIKNAKGFDLRADFWGNHLGKVVGQDGNKLKQQYALAVAKKHCTGYRLSITTKEDGTIVIDATN